MNTTNIYDIAINDIDGQPLSFKAYEGKYILIVNVASECGYTPQYAQLQELYENLNEKIVVIGVPCNDFGAQEPGSADEIKTFCSTKYKVTFPMTEKVNILENTHPLYQYLTQVEKNGVADYTVKWNFTKFLISPKGDLLASFPSSVSPVSEDIISLIEE